MFYYLHFLSNWISEFRVFKYITVRAFAGAATSFLLCVLLGPWVIRKLRALKVQQYVRKEEAPPLHVLHGNKEGTPTMGGILIIGSVTASTLLWAMPTNSFVLLTLLTFLFMGFVGYLDDSAKLKGKNAKGLSARAKFRLQVLWAVIMGGALLVLPETQEHVRELMVPFFKGPFIKDLGWFLALVFVILIIVGASNAVNLTDGLDGLAIGCSSSVALAYLVMAYIAGHRAFADYLFITYIPGTGELAVFCGCLLGGCLGFLWYNCHPAQVFMGDTGSLALGGAIAMVAILIKQELVLMVVGGVFVMEAMSVILQVVSFKLRGKRIFAMAPIHHHFELKKWSETQVTIRFWILSILFALLGVATLKIR
ncbi:MAG: phospho-N-acetylmuramoyl-pentapeptide-transferase [bacterium]